LACEICYPVTIRPVVFQKFWEFLFKFEYTIEEYNGKTIGGVLELLSMDNREREETCHKGRCRNIMDRIIESIRYKQQPIHKDKGLRSIILVIVRDCIERDLENEVFDRLIGNRELVKYGYILEDWDVEKRFQKFWDWYKTEWRTNRITIDIEIIVKFRELVYAEEEIVKEDTKIMDMMELIGPEVGIEITAERINEMTEKIKGKFIETRQFTKEDESEESSIESYDVKDSGSEERNMDELDV
jgi:hypothetical protein